MKERPILMSGPLVREILSGRKSVTRRPVKPQPMLPDGVGPLRPCLFQYDGAAWVFHVEAWPEAGVWGPCGAWRCPYGSPGDRLWVRETAEVVLDRAFPSKPPPEHFRAAVRYRADDARDYINVHMEHWRCKYECKPRWTPGIHMPRWASRLTLDVTAVRVERLHEITEEDAQAEGVAPLTVASATTCEGSAPRPSFRHGFALKWREIYGDESWDANPWVWVISFRRAEG